MPEYFAYGSNLDPVQLARREVAFRRPRRARLLGWRLAFNKLATLHAVPGEGRANIVPARRRIVEGVVFDVSDEGLANLDWFEGACSGHYVRRTITLRLDDGAPIDAVTYVARFTATGLRPSPWYLAHIVDGARHFGLSEDYVAALEAISTVGPVERPAARI